MTELRRFVPAKDRAYIQREGFYPDAKYQLSVSPHPELPLTTLPKIPLDRAPWELGNMWQSLLHQRQDGEGLITYSREVNAFPYGSLNPVVFAPTTEQLFKEAIVPVVREFCRANNRNELVVDEAGYLFPFWSRGELMPAEIMEGPLQAFIKEGGKLPNSVGAVYLDFPSSVNTLVTGADVVKFIRNHPSTLFIIDQANLYFSRMGTNFGDDLMLTGGGKLLPSDLAIVTNTTTKGMGMTGSAVGAITDRTRDLLEPILSKELPFAIGFDEDSFLRARQILASEIQPNPETSGSATLTAFRYRRTIAENREKLKALLEEKFGEAAHSPELHTAGPHIFINAQVLGFSSAQELCDTLAAKFLIATKRASVYTNQEEYDKYVYMAIPWNDEIMRVVLRAFGALTIASQA